MRHPLSAIVLLAACTEVPPSEPVEANLDEAGRVCAGNETRAPWEPGVDDEAGRSVGNLVENASGERQCSGALVAPNLFLTAGHCLDPAVLGIGTTPQDVCDAMHVEFEYHLVNGVAQTTSTPYACAEVLAQLHSGLEDHALIRLEGDPGLEFGYVEMDFRAPVVGEHITLIHHPEGVPKTVSTGIVLGVTADGMVHDAATWNASSGALVLDADGRVIGINTGHTGDHLDPCNANNGNFARRLDHVRGHVDLLATTDWMDQDEDGSVEAFDHYGEVLAAGDFDGDGFEDLVVGTPSEDITTGGNSYVNAGAITVRYGSAVGPSAASEDTFWPTPQANAEAGSALAVGDFDGDGDDDLAVGAPLFDGGSSNEGLVYIYWGRWTGFSGPDTLDAGDAGGTPQSGAKFGFALTAGDFDDDGRDDLVVGAPYEDGGATDAGRVYMVSGDYLVDSFGLRETFDQAETGTGNTLGSDWFGYSLAVGDFDADGDTDLAVGAPGESTAQVNDTGFVTIVKSVGHVLTPTASLGIGQSHVGETREANDRFGEVLVSADFDRAEGDDLAVGVPNEDSATGASNAGLVVVWYGNAGGGMDRSQLLRSTDFAWWATESAGNQFGGSLAAGNLDGTADDDLAVGMTGWDYPVTNTGLVMTFLGAGVGADLVAGEDVDGSPLVEASAYDEVGNALAIGDFDDSGVSELAVGIKNFDRDFAYDSGAVAIFALD